MGRAMHLFNLYVNIDVSHRFTMVVCCFFGFGFPTFHVTCPVTSSEASPGCTSLTISQAMEADWNHLKKTLPMNVCRLAPQDALKSVMSAIEALLSIEPPSPKLDLPGFSKRLVSGSAMFTNRLPGMGNSQIRVPSARLYWENCPDNVCSFTGVLQDSVEIVYVMPFSNPELKLEIKVAQVMVDLLVAAQGTLQQASRLDINIVL